MIRWTLEEVGTESKVPDFIPLGILANEEVSKVGKICPHSKVSCSLHQNLYKAFENFQSLFWRGSK